jgi:hypothetical protein
MEKEHSFLLMVKYSKEDGEMGINMEKDNLN